MAEKRGSRALQWGDMREVGASERKGNERRAINLECFQIALLRGNINHNA
jgi:hypothetical protein